MGIRKSLPSIDLIIELSKLFDTSIEEILRLINELASNIDESNIFKEHNRKYILDKVIDGEIKVNLVNVFYQFSPIERILIINAIKEGKIKVNIKDFSTRLTDIEKRLLHEKESK